MDAEPFPIAYGALQPGTPVQTSDGREFGTVAAVLVDEPVDVFDGINVETSAAPGSWMPTRSTGSSRPT